MKKIAAALLPQSSDELSDYVFTAAWDYEKAAEEDEEDIEPLDEGFHLDMAQERMTSRFSR
jgi:hypothetical protein